MFPLPFNPIEAIAARHSVRTFRPEPVPDDVRIDILHFASGIASELGPSPRMALIDKAVSSNGERLGTYGIVKNARLFMAFASNGAPNDLIGVGYAGECVMLYCVSKGLGAVWLGGTFSKGAFAKAMKLGEGEVLPAVFPIGYPAERRLAERIMRRFAKSDARKPWAQMFFHNDFRTPLTPHEAGDYAEAFELMRMAPSSVNCQPWRALMMADAIHFYVDMKAGDSESDRRMKYIDIGIGLCHFQLAARHRGLRCEFSAMDPGLPTAYCYVASIKI